MREDLLEILCRATAEHLTLQIVTNGTLVTDDILQAIFNLGIGDVCFSLDGAREATNDCTRGNGSFRRIMNAIEHAVEIKQRIRAQTTLSINTVLTKVNLTEVDSIVTLACNLGIDRLVLSAVSRQGSAIDHWRNLDPPYDALIQAGYRILVRGSATGGKPVIQQNFITNRLIDYYNEVCGLDIHHKYLHCSAGLRAAFMRPDGVMSPCPSLVDAEADKAIRSQIERECRLPSCSLDKAWQSASFTKFRRLWNTDYRHCYRPCDTCPHFRKLCNPCIIPALTGKPYVEPLCYRAEELLALRCDVASNA